MASKKDVLITLSEQYGVRYLHFGSEWIQGGMQISDPFRLILNYQKQMMAAALFLPAPQQVLQLGLGAAALTKFCWLHLPQSSITAVELSSQVIETAYQWFELPKDARICVVASDAYQYLKKNALPASAHWLQVDLYDAAARGPVYDDVSFYRACRRVLARPGVAVFNLFGRRFEPSRLAISTAFNNRILVLPEIDEGNRIVFGFTGPPIKISLTQLAERAQQLEVQWKLPMSSIWLQQLTYENGLEQHLVL